MALHPWLRRGGLIGAASFFVTEKHGKVDIIAVILADGSESALADTLAALCEQSSTCWRAVIAGPAAQIDVVNNGRLWARALAPRVALAWTANTTAGSVWQEALSVARNRWPGARADVLMRAGELPHPNFMQVVDRGIAAAPLSIGWFIPGIGLPSSSDVLSLTHLLTITDAPALVIRRETFYAGLAIDAQLEAGDCRRDFSMRAKARGFAGRGLPHAVLAHSGYPASTLPADSPLWPWRLWARRGTLIQACLEETPPFAWLAEDGARHLFADPDTLLTVADQEAVDKRAYSPRMTCLAARAVWTHLKGWRVLKGILWRAQRALRYVPVVLVILDEDPDRGFSLRITHAADSRDAAQADMVIVGTAPLFDAARLLQYRSRGAGVLRVALPDVSRLSGVTPGLELLKRAIHPTAPSAGLPEGSGLPVRDPFRLAGFGLPYPDIAASGCYRVAYLLPLFSFAGVEKVVLAQAKFLTMKGCDVHLFITTADAVWLPVAPWPSNINITLVGDARMGQSAPDGALYARSILAESPVPEDDDLFGLLAGMNAVITTHCLGGYGLARRLSAAGVKVAASLHLLEPSLGCLPIGDAWNTLGHADALDAVFVISRQLWRWCEAHGLPRSKLRLLPNAPGYVSTAAPPVPRQLIATRRLRVLFMGRLDRQKGLDRLGPIMAAATTIFIEWRIVGGVVIDQTTPLLSAPLAGLIEPPARTAQELDAHYDWADIFILPSHFEGVPLTVLEAQRRGCVVLATDVGAVSEVVEHDANGLLVPAGLNEADTTDCFVHYLKEMAACPARLAKFSQVALTRSETHLEAWGKGLEELLAFVRSSETGQE